MPYPITNNPQEISDGLNYVLSGPGGLGQNFAGFSSYATGYITGNIRTPYSQPTLANLYVAPISLSNAQQLDSRTIKYTFSSAQPTAPFALGNGLSVKGIIPSTYNSANLQSAGTSIYQIGVIECTTTYVVVRTVAEITSPLGTYTSGGTINYSSTDTTNNSTDCDVRVTILGKQERVFVSAQLDQTISYTATSPQDLTVYVEITRYTAFTNNDPTNPDFIFDDATTIISKQYEFPGLTGTGTLPLIETSFVNVIDNLLDPLTNRPMTGYYRYILEVYFQTPDYLLEVTSDEIKVRSITAQVVKP